MALDRSVLIVEDEHTLRRLLEYRLGKFYDVRTAADGRDALERVEEAPPDLIVSDIMMPRMNGFALQDALQGEKATRAIPFIFLTAKADAESRLKGLRTGVDDYITKPFDVEQLLSRIDRLLERTEVYRSELDAKIGQDFSRRLMPKSMPEAAGYRVFFRNRPKDYGGGDFFDWTEPEPGVFFLTVGDVMGKGLQAKFYAYGFLSYLRNTLRASLRETASPAELMRRVNRMLIEDEAMEDTFASLLIVRWEPDAHRITYANAGHCRPLLVAPGGPQIVEYSDLILGLEPEAHFQDTSFALTDGSALLLYTDGLLEQPRPDGEMMGEAGVMAAAAPARTAAAPVDHLLSGLLEASGMDRFEDDILAFWMQRGQHTEARRPRRRENGTRSEMSGA